MLETLIVVGIFALLSGVVAIVGIDSITRATAHGERDLFVSLLISARAQSLANINERAHGIHIGGPEYVLFEGSLYDASDPANVSVPRESAVTVTGPVDIIFDRLSGSVSTDVGTVTFVEGTSSTTVEINAFGRIEW